MLDVLVKAALELAREGAKAIAKALVKMFD